MYHDKNKIRKLIERAQKNDKVSLDELITFNEGLVWKICNKFLDKGLDKDDLYQLGIIGLIKAIKNFNFKYNVEFSTYAVPKIIGEIKRYFRDNKPIRVSRNLKNIAYEIHKYKEEKRISKGTEPSIKELANELDYELEDIILAMEIPDNILSLDEVVFNRSGNSSIHRIEQISDNKKNEEEIINKIAIDKALDKLSEQNKNIIILRYFKDKTQTEIAKELGLTQVQVSRLEKKILLELKYEIQDNN